MFGSTGCGANGMYFPAMSFWPGMWRRAGRARLRLQRRWTPARAKELLQTRRPPAGEVLWLRAQGYSFAEIAQRCGVSESAARTLDFRTRHWLREQLQKEGAEL